VLSPAAECPGEAIKLIADLSTLMGLKVHFTEPAEHDGMIAGMEGLPVLLQMGLFRSLSKATTWRDTQWLTNPAFVHMTYRLALETPEDMAALLHRNRENTLGKLDALIEDLTEIRDLLATGDEIAVAEVFQDAANRYDRWRINRIRGAWETDAERQASEMLSPRSFSLMGGAFGNLFSRGKKSKDSKGR
jgi:prephenate dehydrogenase